MQESSYTKEDKVGSTSKYFLPAIECDNPYKSVVVVNENYMYFVDKLMSLNSMVKLVYFLSSTLQDV